MFTDKVISKLKKKEVEGHIELLINFNRNKNSMVNSVYEWEYDLIKLRKYKGNS